MFLNLNIGINSVIMIAFIFVFTLMFWYLKRNQNYWYSKGINGPWPLPGIGTIIHILIDHVTIVEEKWLKTFGKVYGVYDGNKPVLRVGEPELIKQILVKDFHLFTDRRPNINGHPISSRALNLLNGEDWKRIRNIMSPVFTTAKLKKMDPLIRQCVKDLIIDLEKQSKNGNEVDMKLMFGRYTMDVISTCAFALKTDIYNNPDHQFIKNIIRLFDPNYFRIILSLVLPSAVLKFLQINMFTSTEMDEYFFDIIKGVLKERKTSNKTYNDYIDLILSLAKNDGREELEMEKNSLSRSQKYMTENEIIANAQMFLVAGYMTTAATISHCAQELALNPNIQAKLYSEIMPLFDSKGDIDYDLLSKLPYLDAVISETLRLHSPVMHLIRMVSTDYKLGDTGITLVKGQNVEVPIFALHRCEEYFPNADQFIPERFLPENRHQIIPYTYLPFGDGPRNCLGTKMALMEAKLALAHVLQQFQLSSSTTTDIPVLLEKSLLFDTPKRVMVKLLKRY